MTASEKLLSLYRRAVRLYPRTFREDYTEELVEVFAMRLDAQEPHGMKGLLRTSLRELRDLPLALVAAYLRERRKQKMNQYLNRWFGSNPGPGKELLLATLPFWLIGFVPGLLSKIPPVQNLPQLAGFLILGILFLILATLGIIGLLVSLPRWSLTYAGISLTLFSLSVINSLNLFGLHTDSSAWSLLRLNAVLMGIFLVILALSTAVLLWAAARIRLMQPFATNLRHDRTLISFMFYGGALVLTFSHYEDILDGGVYLMLSALVMAAGVWGYFRSTSPAGRIWALIAGATLGSAFTLAANLRLPGVPRLVSMAFAGLQIESAVGFVGLTWLTSLVMILAPLAVSPAKAAPQQAQTA